MIGMVDLNGFPSHNGRLLIMKTRDNEWLLGHSTSGARVPDQTLGGHYVAATINKL